MSGDDVSSSRGEMGGYGAAASGYRASEFARGELDGAGQDGGEPEAGRFSVFPGRDDRAEGHAGVGTQDPAATQDVPLDERQGGPPHADVMGGVSATQDPTHLPAVEIRLVPRAGGRSGVMPVDGGTLAVGRAGCRWSSIYKLQG